MAEPAKVVIDPATLFDKGDPHTLFDIHKTLDKSDLGLIARATYKPTNELCILKKMYIEDPTDALEIYEEIDKLKKLVHPKYVKFVGSWAEGEKTIW
ncbi:MAG: hypothetical protein EZS28_002818, partial [Streblomastix strix]